MDADVSHPMMPSTRKTGAVRGLIVGMMEAIGAFAGTMLAIMSLRALPRALVESQSIMPIHGARLIRQATLACNAVFTLCRNSETAPGQ